MADKKKQVVDKNDSQYIAKTDPNKFAVKSLAEKIKERQKMNDKALADIN